MALDNQNFTMYQVNHKRLVFTVEDAYSLAGATIKWACSKHSALHPAVMEKGMENITIEGNTFTVYLVPADTANLEPGVYYHEAKIKDAAGNEVTAATGMTMVLPVLVKGVI